MKKDEESLQAMLEEMAVKYRASMPGKVKKLSDLVDKIIDHPNEENKKNLRDETHKLAGSAGMYGFINVSDICKKMVIVLDGWKELKKISQEKTKELKNFIKDLEKGVTLQEKKFFDEEIKIAPLSKGDDFSLDLFIAYFEEDILLLLEKEALRRGLRVKICSDPEEVIEIVKNKDFNPRVLIIGNCYSKKPEMYQKLKKSFKPIGILKEYKQKEKKTILGAILPKADLESRILSMSEGVDYVIEEPVVVDRIFEIVESSLPAYFEKAFKVLVLDDDPDICAFISSVLTSINVDVKTISTTKHFLDTVNSFQPDLLLLDLRLDNYSGIDILKTIRRDPLWKNLSVIVITVLREDEWITEAYKQQVDDFIVKPLARNILQSKVLRFAYLQAFKEMQQVREALTGLYSKRAFLYALSRQIEKIPSKDMVASVSLLQIMRWNEIKEDEAEATRVIVDISNHLKMEFPFREIIARFEEDCFALFFENTGPLEAKELILSFIHSCPVIARLKSDGEIKVPFCAGIAAFSQDGDSASILIDSAEDYLSKAYRLGDGFVVCSEEKIEKKEAKEIYILDDDTDICTVLSFAFAKQGFKVTIKNSLEEAEKDIKKRTLASLPSLFIFDRLLPDGDSLDFYRKIKREFERFPNVLFLSRLSSEKDVMEGLREGAIDYIAKPFSVTILVEKAMKLLKK